MKFTQEHLDVMFKTLGTQPNTDIIAANLKEKLFAIQDKTTRKAVDAIQMKLKNGAA